MNGLGSATETLPQGRIEPCHFPPIRPCGAANWYSTPAEPNLPGKNQPRPEQRRSGETDADPNDEPGNGRGVAGGGRSLEATDAGPTDEAGRGRDGNGVTDADPGDPAGQGRGAPPPPLRNGIPTKKA